MEKKPLISVIIPVYNTEKYLHECIKSVIGQTYGELEIILVDDGSSDGSSQICDDYAARNSGIVVFHKMNEGLVAAWIDGVKIARGEYLCFVDSDDWIDPTMIEQLKKHISGKCREIICCNYMIEKRSQSIPMIQGMMPGEYKGEEIRKSIFPRLLGNERRSIHCSRCMKLFSRELIEKNICYCNTKITGGEDFSIFLPVILDAERVVILEEGCYYHYRFVESSMVHQYTLGLYENMKLLYSTLKNVLENKGKERSDIQSLGGDLKKEYLFFILQVIKNELRNPERSYREEIQSICKEVNADRKGIGIDVRLMRNRLVYMILRHPGRLQIALGRLAITAFDRMGKLGE